MLLHTWRQLSTPNLASVLDIRRGVWVRGGVELCGDGLHRTVTCEHSTTVVTQSCTTVDDSFAGERHSNISPSTGTMSSSGIMSRGFTMALGQNVGLASILDPRPRHLTSCHKHEPNDTHSGLPSRCDLQSNNMSQCQKVVESSEVTLDPAVSLGSVLIPSHTLSTHLPSSELQPEFCQCRGTSFTQGLETSLVNHYTGCDASTCSKDGIHSNKLPAEMCFQRPSSDLQAEADLHLNHNAPRTSSCWQQSCPLCCRCCRPPPHPCGIVSTPASTVDSSAVSPCHTGSSLYDELQPYLGDDETEDLYSSSISTDDEY